jgi:hypothetical protein
MDLRRREGRTVRRYCIRRSRESIFERVQVYQG